MLQALTNFADQGVILPVAGITAVALAAIGWWRGFMAWVGVVVSVLALTGTGKIFALVCGSSLPVPWHLRSPSGHTASAAVVYGGLAALMLPWRLRPIASLLTASLVAAAIGSSRLLLGLHSLADVLVGGAIGVAGACLLGRLAGPAPALRYHPGWIVLAVFLTALAFHGHRLRAEAWIHAVAAGIGPDGRCAVTKPYNGQ